MKMTAIHLTSPGGLVIAKPEIMWPPANGEPEVILAAGKVFVWTRQPGASPPTYREASAMTIANIDF